MAHTSSHAHSHDHHDDHAHMGIKGYLLVFAALMVGTFLTVWVADIGHKMHFGRLTAALLALAIAFTKASLVLYYFMHLRESPKIIGFTAVGGFVWLSLLFIFTFADYMGRQQMPVGVSWDKEFQFTTPIDAGGSVHVVTTLPAPAASATTEAPAVTEPAPASPETPSSDVPPPPPPATN